MKAAWTWANGGNMENIILDCWCSTCERKVTLAEIRTDFHTGHAFDEPEKMGLHTISNYVKAAHSAA